MFHYINKKLSAREENNIIFKKDNIYIIIILKKKKKKCREQFPQVEFRPCVVSKCVCVCFLFVSEKEGERTIDPRRGLSCCCCCCESCWVFLVCVVVVVVFFAHTKKKLYIYIYLYTSLWGKTISPHVFLVLLLLVGATSYVVQQLQRRYEDTMWVLRSYTYIILRILTMRIHTIFQ